MAVTPMWINGVAINPTTLKVQRCKEWAEGSGRATNGEWQGDIKCKKWKLEVVVKQLSDDEAVSVLTNADPDDKDFISVKFKNPYNHGNYTTTTCYSSDTSADVQTYADGIKTYSQVSFSLVGR